MKLYIGCAYPPIHPQHYQLFPDLDEWVWVDYYVEHPRIERWKAEDLPVDDNSIEAIYSSHLLEHIRQTEVMATVKHWYNKLKKGGELVINVPDLSWAATQIIKYENGQPLDSGVYYEWFGNNGLLTILYGTEAHDGEYHYSGYTTRSLMELLEETGFKDITVERLYDAHDMGVLLARCKK